MSWFRFDKFQNAMSIERKDFKYKDIKFKYNKNEWESALSSLNRQKYKDEIFSKRNRSKEEIENLRKSRYRKSEALKVIISDTKLYILLAHYFDINSPLSDLPIEIIDNIFQYITKESIATMDCNKDLF